MHKAAFLPMVLLGSLVACGGREARPVPEASAWDHQLSCAHLLGELGVNQSRLAELGRETNRRGLDNVGMVLAAPAGLLFLDTGQAQGAEIEALNRRNARLQALLVARSCPAG
ncbi:MAG: hypothetical protein K2X11_08510 [Acetobacteraceae bacterium]|nr:hypothetical protein [Acetobacteraceae bacterium]